MRLRQKNKVEYVEYDRMPGHFMEDYYPLFIFVASADVCIFVLYCLFHCCLDSTFEAVSARMAFPCFDEPAFKANFSISIVTEKEYTTVLSNMPAIGAPEIIGDWQRVNFETTPRMSTYLVAYAICNFVNIEGQTSRGVPVRVWAAIDKINQADIALKAAIIAINKFEEFFALVS